MVNRRVMIALDGKNQSEKAFDWYLENMNKPGDHVVLVHCSQFQLHVGLPGVAVNVEHVSKQVKDAKDKADDIMSKATAVLRGKEIMAYTVIKSSSKPHEALLEAAIEEEVDHIVMGTRDLGTVKRALIGSVSTEVVRQAAVPVTVVKNEG